MQHPLRRLILATVSAATAFLAFGQAAFADDEGNYIPPNVGFYDVPNQGPENVPGDFCGGDGSIGDVIPDGMFRAYVTEINDHEVGLDLICVYRTPQDDTIYQVPDGYVTNNNTRVRWMPINDGLTIHGSAEGHGNMHYDWDVPFDQSMDAWVGVYGGRVHFIVSAPSFHDDGTYDDGEDDGHCGC